MSKMALTHLRPDAGHYQRVLAATELLFVQMKHVQLKLSLLESLAIPKHNNNI